LKVLVIDFTLNALVISINDPWYVEPPKVARLGAMPSILH